MSHIGLIKMMHKLSIKIKQDTLQELTQLSEFLTKHNETGLKVTINGLIRNAVYDMLENKNSILHNVEKVKSFPLILRAKDYTYKAMEYKPNDPDHFKKVRELLDQRDKEADLLNNDEEE